MFFHNKDGDSIKFHRDGGVILYINNSKDIYSTTHYVEGTFIQGHEPKG